MGDAVAVGEGAWVLVGQGVREGPAVGLRVGVNVTLKMVGLVVRVGLDRKGVPVREVEPGT